MGTRIGFRRWETYVALLAVILGSLSSLAESPRATLTMIAAAVGLLALVVVSLLRRARVKKPRRRSFDAGERAARIREARHNRYSR